jgi:hypothetical protein
LARLRSRVELRPLLSHSIPSETFLKRDQQEEQSPLATRTPPVPASGHMSYGLASRRCQYDIQKSTYLKNKI